MGEEGLVGNRVCLEEREYWGEGIFEAAGLIGVTN